MMKVTKKIRLIKKQDIPALRPEKPKPAQKSAMDVVKGWISRRKTNEPQYARQMFADLFGQP